RPADLHPLAPLIDQTLLKPTATEAQIRALCEGAIQYHFASVCINPCWIPVAAELLKGRTPKVCTVVGFPLGAMATRSKAEETRIAVEDGADEIDMVLAVGHLMSGQLRYVHDDIKAVVEAAGGRTTK